MVNYLSVTKITNGDCNIPNVDKFYEETIRSNTVGYCCGIMDRMNSNGYYINGGNMVMYVNKTEMGNLGIRLLFDDGG